MKTTHKVIGTGAFGGLAAMTLAASGAFACTEAAYVRTNAPTIVEPGAEVTVRGGLFLPAPSGQEVVVTLVENRMGGFAAPLFAAAAPSPEVDPDDDQFTQVVAIPEVPSGQYLVRARQTDTRGMVTGEKVATPVWVSNPDYVPPAPPPTQPPPTTAAPNRTETTTRTPAPPASQPSSPRGGAPDRPGSAPAGPTLANGNAGPSGAAAGAAEAPQVVAPAEQVASGQAQPAPEAALLPPAAMQSSDLWSGLNADDTPSLLDSAAPDSRRTGSPVGAVLLGSGLVALAAVALAATRRRLAVSRITRR